MPPLSERKWENERGRHIASDMPVNSITLQFVRSICAMCVWVISLVVSLLFSTLMRFLFSISLSLSLILAHFCCWDLLLCVFFFFCSLFIKFPVLLVTAVISCIGKCFSIDSKLFSSVVFVSFLSSPLSFRCLMACTTYIRILISLDICSLQFMKRCASACVRFFQIHVCVSVCQFGFRLRLLVWMVEMA